MSELSELTKAIERVSSSLMAKGLEKEAGVVKDAAFGTSIYPSSRPGDKLKNRIQNPSYKTKPGPSDKTETFGDPNAPDVEHLSTPPLSVDELVKTINKYRSSPLPKLETELRDLGKNPSKNSRKLNLLREVMREKSDGDKGYVNDIIKKTKMKKYAEDLKVASQSIEDKDAAEQVAKLAARVMEIATTEAPFFKSVPQDLSMTVDYSNQGVGDFREDFKEYKKMSPGQLDLALVKAKRDPRTNAIKISILESMKNDPDFRKNIEDGKEKGVGNYLKELFRKKAMLLQCAQDLEVIHTAAKAIGNGDVAEKVDSLIARTASAANNVIADEHYLVKTLEQKFQDIISDEPEIVLDEFEKAVQSLEDAFEQALAKVRDYNGYKFKKLIDTTRKAVKDDPEKAKAQADKLVYSTVQMVKSLDRKIKNTFNDYNK
jgi:hypothetical protein